MRDKISMFFTQTENEGLVIKNLRWNDDDDSTMFRVRRLHRE